jgi:prolyl 4-hydroxylase
MVSDYEFNRDLESKFIQGWYISESICDQILQSFKRLQDQSLNVYLGEPKNYFVSSLTDEKSYDSELSDRYKGELSLCLKKYLGTYQFACTNGKHYLFNDINVQYFKPPLHYSKFHCERTSNGNSIFRTLVFITYLNDVKENGETEFFYQKTKIKPKKGLTIIWPTEWTHAHRGISTNEDKYIVTGWFEYIPVYESYHVDLYDKELNNA